MCTSSSNGAAVVVKESGRQFAYLNPSNQVVGLTKVDGCAITQGIRCDYLYLLQSSREIYVELKGADIKRAVKQIAASIPKLSRVAQEARAAVVVASRVPRADTSTQIAIASLRRADVRKLVVRSGPRVELTEAQVFA